MGTLFQELRSSRRSSVDSLGLGEWLEMFKFAGNDYATWPSTALGGKEEPIGAGYLGMAEGAYKACGPVFSCCLMRMMVFSEMRFQFRQRREGRAGKLFGTDALSPLEVPWPNGTTSDLACRAIQDVDLSGNYFHAKRAAGLRRMRPDRVTIVHGSKTGHEIDMEVIGYVYRPLNSAGEDQDPMVLMPEEVAHWAPIPDPTARTRGMSWLTPVVREVLGDRAMTTHKLKFFENGATPGIIVKFDPTVRREDYDVWVDAMEERNKGLAKAYKAMYLGAGADVTVVGGNMKQVDFQNVAGAGESRIASAAGVPPVLAGFAEGLKAATYSNYQQAVRHFADATMRPLWRSFAGANAPLVAVPANAELWYDARDIAFLKEDAKDAEEVKSKKAETISKLIAAGYEPETVIEAVEADDFTLLEHSGLVSVQLWEPGKGPDSPRRPGEEGESPSHPEGTKPEEPAK